MTGLLCMAHAGAAQDAYHIVAPRESLTTIARVHGLSVSDLFAANAPYLLAQYVQVCSQKSTGYRHSVSRRGYFCNDEKKAKYPVHANTLLAGWKLILPTRVVQPAIRDTLARFPGSTVALVVDATGSMSGNIARVADQYRAAIASTHKTLVGIWLFADNKVWTVEKNSFLAHYNPAGVRENTYGALSTAARESKASALVLITDEPGDDWPGVIQGLPPVIAHCLPQDGGTIRTCTTTLNRLVHAIPGSVFVVGERESVPSATSPLPAGGVVPPVRRVSPNSSSHWSNRVLQ